MFKVVWTSGVLITERRIRWKSIFGNQDSRDDGERKLSDMGWESEKLTTEIEEELVKSLKNLKVGSLLV